VPLEQLRTMLFIALGVVMFLMWQQWRVDYAPRPAATTTAGVEQAASTPPAPQQSRADIPTSPSVATTASSAPSSATATDIVQQTAASQGETVEVSTDTMRVLLSLDGGTMSRVELLRYPVAADRPEQPFRLLDATSNPANYFVAQSGLLGQDAPSHHTRFSADQSSYQLPSDEEAITVVLTASTPDSPVVVRKSYTFHRDSYIVDVAYEVTNPGQTPWRGRMYAQFQRGEPVVEGGLFRTYTYTGGVISNAEKPYEKIDFSDMAKADVDRFVEGGWLAMIQHYFVAAWLPDQQASNHYYSKALADGRYVLGVVGSEQEVAPSATATFHMRAFIGPKDQDRMKVAAEHLERTVDYGWLFLIAEPIFWGLQIIHGVVGNWGWSIILLTICIKALFFHLSATSYKSMARMRKLTPRMQALRERYGDDRQRLNQAMMEIYKTEKINPLGGCLPIVVQIPVFISLYWVLLESVELRQAPFIFWLKDLSIHDPYFVLPVAMGITMFIQQRLNPAPPDPIQAKVMMALPFVFTFFFLFFPAGLVLYWFVNNVLSIAQQWVITKKIVGSI